MPDNFINTIQTQEQKIEQNILKAQSLAQEEIQKTEKNAQAVLKQAEILSQADQDKISQTVQSENLRIIKKRKAEAKEELAKLDQIHLAKKEKAVNLIISKILE